MPPKFRLTRADFKMFSNQYARRMRGVYFTLSTTSLPGCTSAKVACIVSKKTVCKAVDRNHIKRRCREIVRPFMPRINQPVAMTFYANPASSMATFDQLAEEVKDLLQKGGLLAG